MDDEPRRADARANRDRLLEVARTALAADPGASLSSVARLAGVGAGTLYRHFPSREALVVGVYRREIDAIVLLAPRLLATHPPLAAFRRWCERLAQFGRMKHGVTDQLRAAISDQDFQATYWPMVAAVRQMLDACARAGHFRPDAGPEDVLVLLSCLWQIAPGPDAEAQAERLRALIFRCLGAAD